jgi:tetratricopeptide (TPR) repeat protein
MKFLNNFRIAVFAVVAITAIVLLPLLSAGFTNWDDDTYVTNNTLLRDFSVANTIRTFTSLHRGLYKPVVMLSFTLDYKLFGLNPAGFHAVNLLIHLINCLLVMWLAMLLSRGKTTVAFVTALLFGIHPMHVESVAWIAERKDLLYTGFFLGSAIAYIKYLESNSIRPYVLSLFLLVLSLASKPQGIMLPAVLLLIDYYRARRLDRKLIIDKVPFALISAGFLLAALRSMHQAQVFFKRSYTAVDNISAAFYGFLSYIWHFFIPLRLAVVYPYPQKINGHLPALFTTAPLITALIVFATLWTVRRNRTAVFGIGFFLATIATGLQFMPITPGVSCDHYSYLPYAGLFFIAGELFFIAVENTATRKTALTVTTALMLCCCMLSFSRARVWHDSLSLWTDELQKYPDNVIGLNNRALAFLDMGDRDNAMSDMQRAISLDPADGHNYLNRGMIYMALGKNDMALADLNRAVSGGSALAQAYLNRGNLLAQSGNCKDAIEDYKHAAEMDEFQDGAYNNLGDCFYKTGDAQEALHAYSVALAINPNFETAWLNRGSVCLSAGNPGCAESDLGNALRFNPSNWNALLKRGIARVQLGKRARAREDFDAALRLSRDNPEILFNRGFLSMQEGNPADAVKDLSSALGLKKGYQEALLNRAAAYYMLRDFRSALRDLDMLISENPGLSQAYNNRAMIRQAGGDTRGAMSDYAMAIKLKPDSLRAYLNRAALIYKTSGCAGAENDLRKAFALDHNLKLPQGIDRCLKTS